MGAARAPDRARRLPRGAGRGGGGRRRGGDRQRLPPLPVQGRPVRRGLPARLAARGRRGARRRRRRPAARRPGGSRPRSRRSRAARCAAAAWPGRCSPSRSTRPSRPSASSSAAPTPRTSPRSCATASPPASCPDQDVGPRRAPRSSARSARRSSARCRPSPGQTSTPTRSSPSSSPSACAPSPTTRTTHADAHPYADHATHEVLNQAPPLEGRNLFADNAPLVEALDREGGGWARERAARRRARSGAASRSRWGVAGQRAPARPAHPRPLRPPLDEVEFHPAWHALMARRRRATELHALPWRDRPAGRARRPRGALRQCSVQAEAGFGCPMTMTFAAVPALRHAARARRRVGPAADRDDLRPRAQARRREGAARCAAWR